MEHAVREACDAAVKLLDEYAPVEISCERYTEKESHPSGQEAFTIRARFPWQRRAQTRIMIETAVDEKIIKPVAKRKIIHEYGEPLDADVQVYALEEIMAEKLRAILQHAEKLKERGWSRSRARDYYDLWRIMGTYKDRLDLSGFSSFLQKKCAVRKVAFAGPEDFFQETMLAYIKKTWDQWLGPLVPGLPSFETVIGELRPQIASLVLATGGGPSL
jgi:predicted nucleotidyltransferase component of viral defense system